MRPLRRDDADGRRARRHRTTLRTLKRQRSRQNGVGGDAQQSQTPRNLSRPPRRAAPVGRLQRSPAPPMRPRRTTHRPPPKRPRHHRGASGVGPLLPKTALLHVAVGVEAGTTRSRCLGGGSKPNSATQRTRDALRLSTVLVLLPRSPCAEALLAHASAAPTQRSVRTTDGCERASASAVRSSAADDRARPRHRAPCCSQQRQALPDSRQLQCA
jgi:hypothetical protein